LRGILQEEKGKLSPWLVACRSLKKSQPLNFSFKEEPCNMYSLAEQE
jgi:hypothetical protein